MPKVSAEGRAWIAAEVTTELADRFRAQAKAEDRSASAQLRHIVRKYLEDAYAAKP